MEYHLRQYLLYTIHTIPTVIKPKTDSLKLVVFVYLANILKFASIITGLNNELGESLSEYIILLANISIDSLLMIILHKVNYKYLRELGSSITCKYILDANELAGH